MKESITINDVYRKFGETAEAAQLLETELGTMLLFYRAVEDGIIHASDAGIEVEKNPAHAAALLSKINRHTLGQLLKNLKNTTQSLNALEALLWNALGERNRLFHSFYRHHNFRRNSDEGRAVMLDDLESIHETILRAYKAVMLLSGADLDALVEAHTDVAVAPIVHVPI